MKSEFKERRAAQPNWTLAREKDRDMETVEQSRMVHDLIQLSDLALQQGNHELAKKGYRHAMACLSEKIEDYELREEIAYFLEDDATPETTLGDFIAKYYSERLSLYDNIEDIFAIEPFFGGVEWRRNILLLSIPMAMQDFPDFEAQIEFASLLAQTGAKDEAKDMIVDGLDTFSASISFDHLASLIHEKLGHYPWSDELIRSVYPK